LHILHAKNRLLYGSTTYNPISRFVGEIPDELMLKHQNPSYASHQSMSGGHSTWGGAAATRTRVPQQPANLKNDITVGKSLFGGGAQTQNRAAANALSVGDRVSHPVFGQGTVLSTRQMAADTLIEVAFDTVGTKKLMATYAKLKKI
jgi:DNA helicase-2/ATP-dependent DNA helicase PcrA